MCTPLKDNEYWVKIAQEVLRARENRCPSQEFNSYFSFASVNTLKKVAKGEFKYLRRSTKQQLTSFRRILDAYKKTYGNKW